MLKAYFQELSNKQMVREQFVFSSLLDWLSIVAHSINKRAKLIQGQLA